MCGFPSSFRVLLIGCVVGSLCCAEDPLQENLQQMKLFAKLAAAAQENVASLGSLPPAPFDPRSAMPEAPKGMSAAETDGGLFFDNDNSTLTYIGNVRFNDPRIRLRAANRVYLILPPSEKKEAAQDVIKTPQKAPEELPRAKVSQPQNQQEKQEQTEEPSAPINAIVENAAVDIPSNKLLLEGRLAAPSLIIHREDAKLTAQNQENHSPAWLFATPSGDIILLGSNIVAEWRDSEGALWRLEVERGPVVYRAATRDLLMRGNALLRSPRGTLRCSDSLKIAFAAPPAGEQRVASREPFSQFANMQLKEVEYAEAIGKVQLSSEQQEGQPASIARGDRMVYNPRTGDCLLAGEQCTLISGERSLHTNGEIKLLPNGDASISGKSITGTYTRPIPGDQSGKFITGTFSTQGPITYDVKENKIHLPSGLKAQDHIASFSCTGAVDIFLKAAANTPSSPERGKNLPNLTIARQDGVARVVARDNISFSSKATETLPSCDLRGDALDAEPEHTTAWVRSTDGRVAHVHYGDYELNAQSPNSRGNATVRLFENGDLLAEGDKVRVQLPIENGRGLATCDTSLRLNREEALLVMGRNARIETPEGIFSARGPVRARLFTDPSAQPSSASSSLPANLSYNFTGLRSIHTEQGGFIQTPQLSMQCEKLIFIELLEPSSSPSPQANPRDQIRDAHATGRVRLVSKDSSGRLLRADGDALDFDPVSRNFYLRGNKVFLRDEFNSHTASGSGACATIDPKNNVNISGAEQSTSAEHVHRQINKTKKP